ncbi:MAG: FGGY family carbohydrate kinase, partial [Bacillota bacterium]|nr:FGGY family carbohydrate kinase [Bacillota bacterium]
MAFITIDLGTTNSKVTIFNDNMMELCHASKKVIYQGSGPIVEFDADLYFTAIMSNISNLVAQLDEPVHQIVLTGQAESLVVLDAECRPLRPAISWMDMRSTGESEQIKEKFTEGLAYEITGQPVNTPTWPITKILWLKKHENDCFVRAAHYVLLKDYIQYCLTGVLIGEYSIYNFSYYFDLKKRTYWQDMLDFCSIRRDQLPDLTDPCTPIGMLRPDLASWLGLNKNTLVNCGTLDHFAGMIGTGNIRPGTISESTGTVLSLATLVDQPVFAGKIPCHYGPFRDSFVLLPVCESGGVSLEWFRDKYAAELDYRSIDEQAATRIRPGEVVFLPFLTGSNSPDF